MERSVMLMNLIAIGIGGALGSIARHELNTYTLFTHFPLGTLMENWIGSLMLGVLTGWVLYRKVREWLRVGLGVGFCGGFTTMSTFAADTLFLYEYSLAQLFAYVFLSVAGGILLAAGGLMGMKKFGEARSEKEGERP
jgi:fluoride exporter